MVACTREERTVEEFLGAVTGGAIWGVGFGLALSAVRASSGSLRPIAKTAIVGAVGLSDWLRSATAETRETLEDMYHEARAEMDASGPSSTS
jgi:hypothetical protein